MEIAPIIKRMKCYADEDPKIVLSIRERTFLKAISDAFKQLDAKVCVGKALHGPLGLVSLPSARVGSSLRLCLQLLLCGGFGVSWSDAQRTRRPRPP